MTIYTLKASSWKTAQVLEFMSQKFGNQHRGIGIVSMAALLWLFCLTGCDPCRQLAERICMCRETEVERRECINHLSLSTEHKYFKNAKDGSVCQQALEKGCTCEQINNGQDQQCGMYRPNMNMKQETIDDN